MCPIVWLVLKRPIIREPSAKQSCIEVVTLDSSTAMEEATGVRTTTVVLEEEEEDPVPRVLPIP